MDNSVGQQDFGTFGLPHVHMMRKFVYYIHTLDSVTLLSLMSFRLLYPKTLENGCFWGRAGLHSPMD
jgi:hypothetical protein